MKRCNTFIFLVIFLYLLQGVAVASPPASTNGASVRTVTVNYTYGPDKTIIFSQNNFYIRIGQKLILRQIANTFEEMRNVRFMSSAGNTNFYDVFEVVDDVGMNSPHKDASSDEIAFIARKIGTGILQVVPNFSDWDKAGFLTVSVKP